MTKYDAYQLAENLGIRCCPYCNKNYTTTVITKNKGRVVRPDFDHYYPKKEYPLLALSFYNLIPSCSECNSKVKGKHELQLTTHYHPYLNTTIDNFSFSYERKEVDSIAIEIEYLNTHSEAEKERAKNTCQFFKLKERYDAHQDMAQDIIDLKRAYPDGYLELLQSQFNLPVENSRQEVYRLAMGTHYGEIDFIKRPFSKFKKDLAKLIGLID